jgi:hypothetical protein
MATGDIKIGIDIVSNTKEETKDVLKLKQAYTEAASVASKIGGTAGSRAVASKAAPAGSGAVASKAAPAGLSSKDYGTAQGSTGMGSSARDFAKEAQGLGGLVRVYATFAANLFAVSAAFSALRDAAATENIVKGLDQLGAASGRSLGTLSKQLAIASDGAISLRDSMTAVAQASSGGLNNKQILELGDVAKKASEALGLAMPDAISRLSRGITKIEPELLDELGIFVKVDEASQKYALSIGKSAASLSDFEKRQAFANAVLQQGKEKFAAIDAAANPYDKLLASAANLATAGLQLINNFLGPVAKFLSESPVALSLVFAGIATILLKQAIPALGEFRKGLRASAEEALNSAKTFKSSFGDKFQSILEQRFKIPDLSSDISKIEKDLAKIKMPTGLSKAGSLSALSTTTEADPASLKSVNALLKNRNDIIETGMKGSKAATEQQITSAKIERDIIQKTIALYQKRLELTTAQTGLQTEADKQSIFHPETIALEKYTKLKTKVDQADIVANAAQNAGIVGVGQSWAILNKEIEEKGIKGVDKFSTQFRGGLAAITERLSGLLGTLGVLGQTIGAVVVVYSLFDNAASKAAKEQENLNTKIQESADSVKTVNDTFTLYTEKKKNAFGIEGIVAFTNALSQVSTSFDTQLDALLQFRKAAGVWDQLKDDIASIFSKSNTDNIKKNVTGSVTAILKSLEFSSGGDAAKKGIAGILNLKPEQLDDINALKKAAEQLDEVGLGKLAKEFKNIEEREQFTTNAAKAFMESLADINKLVDQLIQSNAFTDLQGKIGVDLVLAAERLSQALMDPLKALENIAAIGKNPKLLAIIGNDDLKYLVQAAQIIKDIDAAEQELSKTKEAYKKANTVSMPDLPSGSFVDTSEIAAAAEIAAKVDDAATKAAKNAFEKTEENLKNIKKSAIELTAQGVDLVVKISEEGFKRINLGLQLAKEQAALTVQSAKIGFATAAGLDTSKQEAAVKTAEIAIQNRLIEASAKAEMATIENTKILQKLTATQEILAADALKAKSGTPTEMAANVKLADSMSESANKTLAKFNAEAAIKNKSNLVPNARFSPMQAFGETAVKQAQASINNDKIPAMKAEAAKAGNKAKIEIIDLEAQNKQEEKSFQLKQLQLSLVKENLALQVEELNNYSQLATFMTSSILAEKENLSIANLKADTDIKAQAIVRERELLEKNRAYGDQEAYKKQIELNTKKMESLTLEEQTKIFAIQINTIKEKGIGIQTKLSQESAIALEKQKLVNSIEDARISNLQAELGFKQQLGLIDEKTVNAKKAEYELQTLQLRSSEEEAKIKADILLKEESLKTAKEITAAASKTENETAINSALNVQTTAQSALDLAKQQLTTLQQRTTLQQTQIDQAKTYNDRLIEQKQHLEDLVSLTTSLGAVFGDVGTNIGNAVAAADALLKTQKDRAEALALAGNDEKAIANIKAKFDKQEFSNNTALLGQTKKLFNEKSTGYKVIGAVEKAMHAAKIANMVREGAVKAQETLASMGITTMADAASALTKLPGTMMSFVQQMGPWVGIPAGIAFIASLGLGGGSHGAMAFAPNSQQRQEVAGTGMTYDAQGNKVETGGGVFGDASAKSESIANSMQILTTQGIEGLDYDKKLLKSFQRLSDALTHASEVIYAIPGLRMGGTDFGTQSGTSSIGGGNGFLNSLGLGGIFGGQISASTSIESAGIQLRGSLQDFIDETEGSVYKYKDVITQFHKDGGWFGRDEDWPTRNREIGTIAKDIKDALRDVFLNARDVMVDIGDKVGVGVGTINAAFKTIDFQGIQGDIDSMGLTGQAALDQFNAIIGQKLDETARVAFPYFDKFKKFGEGFLETVIRVADGNDKVSQSLIAMGNVSNIADNFDVSEKLIKAAGGLDKFRSQSDFFTSTFLTDAERLIPVQAGVTKQMRLLGLDTNITRAQFAKLVQAQDLTTTAGRNLYQSLMDLAPGFDIISKSAETALKDTITKFTDFGKTIRNYLVDLSKGALSTLSPEQKYAEAGTTFSETIAKALTGDKDAMSTALSSATTFLEASKGFNASSPQYLKDVEIVTTKLGLLETISTDKATVAQQQLDGIQTSATLLASIDANILKLVTPAGYASGGYASGWALVGERGPEMVNFSNPAQVYTAEQTRGMFSAGQSMGAMVNELQQLRNEVRQLRTDQQKQTGDIIISNYDANQQAADSISGAVKEVNIDTAWTARSQPVLK